MDSQLLTLTRLWKKTSAKGSTYLAGRLGNAKVLIMEAKPDPDSDHSHVLMLAPGGDKPASAKRLVPVNGDSPPPSDYGYGQSTPATTRVTYNSRSPRPAAKRVPMPPSDPMPI
jgi:hypothetical protein